MKKKLHICTDEKILCNWIKLLAGFIQIHVKTINMTCLDVFFTLFHVIVHLMIIMMITMMMMRRIFSSVS